MMQHVTLGQGKDMSKTPVCCEVPSIVSMLIS